MQKSIKSRKSSPLGQPKGRSEGNFEAAGRNERGCREGGEGLKTLRVMQKSAENCKELGIGKLLQEFCGMVMSVRHASSWLRPGAADLIAYAHSAPLP